MRTEVRLLVWKEKENTKEHEMGMGTRGNGNENTWDCGWEHMGNGNGDTWECGWGHMGMGMRKSKKGQGPGDDVTGCSDHPMSFPNVNKEEPTGTIPAVSLQLHSLHK